MLVLSRKVGEKLVVGDSITLTINRIAGHRVSIGIEAPKGVRILRGELEPSIHPAPTGPRPDPDPWHRAACQALQLDAAASS